MNIRCAFDELVSINDLKPHPKNRNKHPDDQLKRLSDILTYQGWRYPVKVSKLSGHVTSGHGRIEAAKLNGWAQVPVNYQDYDSPEQEYADVQADNAIAAWAELDLSGINADVIDLGPDFDIDMLGIEDFVLEPAELVPQADEDSVPENVDTRSKLGDVWQLGRHRLMCGDSTSVDAVEKLMAGEKADMVFTDPPYGMAYKSNAWDSKQSKVQARRTDKEILNDATTDAGQDAIRLLPSVVADQCHIYIWCRWDCFASFLDVTKSISTIKSVIVWDKGGPGLGDLQCSYGDSEWAIHGLLGRKPLAERQNCVWQVNRMKGLAMVHPTQKPIEICERAIENSTKPTEAVLDFFGGSGSTLIACEKTNRRCFMMELDPHYCDVILARWEAYTGLTATLVTEEANGTAAG